MISVFYNSKLKQKMLISCPFMERDKLSSLKANWNGRYKLWEMELNLSNFNAIKKIDDINIAKNVINYFLELAGSQSKVKNKDLFFETKPYKHQEEMVKFGLEKEKAFFLCDVGTGKTKAAIDVVVNLFLENKIQKCLIVCPAPLIINWEIEINKHCKYESTKLVGLQEKRIKLLSENTLFHIINYDMLQKKQYLNRDKNKISVKYTPILQELDKNGYDLVIFDEIHKLKNRNSNRSKGCYYLAKDIKHKLGLTGTLIANSPDDIFMPFKIINENIFGRFYTKFKNRYLIMGGFDAGYGGTKVIGLKNKDEYQACLNTSAIKFELKQVAPYLPERFEIIRKYELSPQTKQLYKKIKDEFIIEYEGQAQETFNVLERMLRLIQVCSGFIPEITGSDSEEKKKIAGRFKTISNEKMELLLSLIDEIGNNKCIIWVRFRHSIDKIAKALEKLNKSYLVYDGRTKDKGIYKQFEDGETQFWIGQIQTGVGYSIPSAKYAIFYELDYSRINWLQSKGRNYRLKGSEGSRYFYYYLQAKSTVEEKVLETLRLKDITSENIMSLIT